METDARKKRRWLIYILALASLLSLGGYAFYRFFIAAKGEPPVVVGDGSLCVNLGQAKFPADPQKEDFKIPFHLSEIWVHTGRLSDAYSCTAAPSCGTGCEPFTLDKADRVAVTFATRMGQMQLGLQDSSTLLLLRRLRLRSSGFPLQGKGQLGCERRIATFENIQIVSVAVGRRTWDCQKTGCWITLVPANRVPGPKCVARE
jgi:hypothetical protein